MNFIEAVKKADVNKHLIGRRYKGAVIDEIIIAPKDCDEYDKFLKSYCASLDAQESVLPFMNSNVDLYIVFDKSKIHQMNMVFISPIDALPKEYNVK